MNEVLIADVPPVKQSADDWIAPDCHGLNFFDIDQSLRGLLEIHMPEELRRHMTPHYRRLGEIAGGRLDDLARMADRHDPVLHHRDPFGRDGDWLEFHPAYREMEQIGYGDFGIHCMSRKNGVHGWPEKIPPVAKYIFQYIFVQSEFGLMCPISATDTSAMLIERYGDEATKAKLLPGMWSQDMTKILKGAQFMTEKTGGSDVGNIELEARQEDGVWKLYGEKWFCSCADGDVALLLARPEGAPDGSRGLGLFALPRHLEDGSRNKYRIVRLKDKLGTRSMASGEIIFEGATAYALGDYGAKPNSGLKQMMDQVNMSRLSHSVRAAAMMRRCLNEAMIVARNRETFGETIIDHPLMRRQLMKIMLPTEQALSGFMYAARTMQQADAGDARATDVLRIMTPLLKFRTCRDNITVATASMEARGGNGYIEDWVNSRLVRDAHLGVLWEGTSSINALDVTGRAVAKVGAHEALGEALHEIVEGADRVPGQFRGELTGLIDQSVAFADEVASKPENEPFSRQATDALYHASCAALLAEEGAALAETTGDARRLLLSRLLIDHRMRPRDPMSLADGPFEVRAAELLLADDPASLDEVTAALAL
jgi:alkylation response protein AidB-like acyl-CoA dehydrogenase